MGPLEATVVLVVSASDVSLSNLVAVIELRAVIGGALQLVLERNLLLRTTVV